MTNESTPGPLSPEDTILAARILQFLRMSDYFAVQKALIYLESHDAGLQVDAYANLRDVLDHLVRAAKPDASIQDIDRHLIEAKDHMRRAGVNPLQTRIDERFAEFDRIGRWYFIRQQLFPDVPSVRDLRKTLQEANELLDTSR